jgi:hypothetical protein
LSFCPTQRRNLVTQNQERLTENGALPFFWEFKGEFKGTEMFISGLQSSPMMKDAEEDVRRRFPEWGLDVSWRFNLHNCMYLKVLNIYLVSQAVPFLVAAWSDGTAVTHRLSSHVTAFKCGNVDPSLYNQIFNVIRGGCTALFLGAKFYIINMHIYKLKFFITADRCKALAEKTRCEYWDA